MKIIVPSSASFYQACAIKLQSYFITKAGGTPYYRLFVNDIVPNAQTTVTDFVEATSALLPNYSAQFFNFNSTAYQAEDSTFHATNDSRVLTHTYGTAAPNTFVYGFFLTNSAKTILVGSGRFSTPVLFSVKYQYMSIQPDIVMFQNNYLDLIFRWNGCDPIY